MKHKVILVSDDSDFFEYIMPKLSLRKSDELFKFNFSQMPEKLNLMSHSILIINSENKHQQALELLDIINNIPAIIFEYNENEDFKIEAYKKGIYSYITLNTPDEEILAKLASVFKISSVVDKNSVYREMLVKKNLISENNEVFLDFNDILDNEISKIQKEALTSTLVAIAPDDKTKFILPANQIETVILNNVRESDILMNYAPCKYFLLLHNTDNDKAGSICTKLLEKLPQGVYAGFSQIGKKSRQQIVNEVLNKLHTAINNECKTNETLNLYKGGNNFKFFRQDFNKKIEQIIIPVFYHIQQTYNDKLYGMKLEQGKGDGYGVLYIKSRHSTGIFKITSPGFAKINIDISIERNVKDDETRTTAIVDTKRVNIEPDEFEEGLLQDLLEQFILEFKEFVSNE